VGALQLESLRKPLESAASQDTLAPPAVYAALARLDGQLSQESTERLLRTEASHRAVVARFAGGPGSANLLGRLIRTDPDAAVRSAAIERLVELDGKAAMPRVVAGLYDRERDVRITAAQRLGSLGAAAVPDLQHVAEIGDREAAQAAVVGLMLTESPEGTEALGRIAEEHPDEAIRTLARTALGAPIGHTH
jgi:HEAT repeat protein